MVRRPSVVLVLASLIAVALFVAGVVTWRMMSTPVLLPSCPPNTACSLGPSLGSPYQLHPLRAELLWAASAVFAMLALGSGFRRWRRPMTAPPAAV
ncbi:MAG TPA: hypothetical protein VFX13_17735 [Gaiellales bacterium]|nr:hypothetical protein [Gaiellales bacterium]